MCELYKTFYGGPSTLTTVGVLILFLVLVLMFFPSQGASTTLQPSSWLGLFNDHVSYAHFGLTLDFEPFHEYLLPVKKTLKSVQYKRMESTCSRLLLCVYSIHKRRSELED